MLSVHSALRFEKWSAAFSKAAWLQIFETIGMRKDTMNTLPREYSVEALKRGEGMTFHPMTGNVLALLVWSENLQEYFHPAWYEIFPWWCGLQGKIALDIALPAGSPYPAHWKFDPFTGERLQGEDASHIFLHLGEGSLLMHSRGGYLFLCERRGRPWYWLPPYYAYAMADLLRNLQILSRKGEEYCFGRATLTRKRWRVFVAASEVESPTTDVVRLKQDFVLHLEGDTESFEMWIRAFTAPEWD